MVITYELFILWQIEAELRKSTKKVEDGREEIGTTEIELKRVCISNLS